MRKMIIAAALLLGVTGAQAQSKLTIAGATPTQIRTMGDMMLAAILEGYCPAWTVNFRSVELIMARERLKPADLTPNGRFAPIMTHVEKWVNEQIDQIEPQNFCSVSEFAFGPEGTIQQNLMMRKKR